MNEQGKKTDSDLIARISFVIGILTALLFKALFRGATTKTAWTKSKMNFWMVYFVFTLLIVYAPSWNIPRIVDHLPWIFSPNLGAWIYFHVSLHVQFVILTVGPLLMWWTALGILATLKIMPYRNALAHLGLKTPTGLEPIVIDVIPTLPGQKKILVKAVGLAVTDFQSKKAVLESALNQFVQDIRVSESNRQVIEIRVSDKELPKLISYDSVSALLLEPFSFIVGEGMSGFIVASLLKVHHLLVAGSSGFGKSFFVKQLLVGLLQSSRHIQLYLIDLKKGVEMKVFEKLENVVVAKDSVSAIQCLDVVAREMDRRFEYLEKMGYTELDCERDQLDRIVVMIDEASELFTIIKSSKSIKASAESARDLADRITKLGRVAGIHLIVATQKVVKETIDTRVQLNINARMIFRVNTKEGSMTVLGNKVAHDLPELGGRGIWSVGSRDLLVQTPKLDNKEVGVKVAELMDKFNGNHSPLLQKMLSIREPNFKETGVDTKGVSQDGVNAAKGAF